MVRHIFGNGTLARPKTANEGDQYHELLTDTVFEFRDGAWVGETAEQPEPQAPVRRHRTRK